MTEHINPNIVTSGNFENIENDENEPLIVDSTGNDNKKDKKKLTAKQWTIIGAFATIIIVLAVGIGIYNLPENRLIRQLDLGQKYLEEQNYEQAVLSFNEAIAIDDRCLEAYVGGIKAYVQLGNKDELQAFYDKALAAAESIEGEVLANNMEYVSSIYLFADDVYDDTTKRIEILEEGLLVTNENAEVKEELINNYIVLAKEYVSKDAFVDALNIYDRLLELDSNNEQVLSGLSSCLTEYYEVLIGEKNYDEVRRLIDKYRIYDLDVDFDSVLIRITELERVEAEISLYINKVYELMKNENYIELSQLYYSDETDMFLDLIDEIYIYYPEDTNIGVGAYKFTNNNSMQDVYFYYGEYKDNIRIGEGVSFGNCGDCHEGIAIFAGTWNDDAPNGYGEERVSHDNGSSYGVTSGILKNGLWDGDVQRVRGNFNMPFTVVNGIPEDKTSEMLAEMPFFTITGMPEDVYIYAYDVVGYDIMFCDIQEGCTIGTIGYGG